MKARASVPSFISNTQLWRAQRTLRGRHDSGEYFLPEKLWRLAQALPASLPGAGLRYAVCRVPAAAGRAGREAAGAVLAQRPDLHRRELYAEGRRAQAGGRAGADHRRAGYQPAWSRGAG